MKSTNRAPASRRASHGLLGKSITALGVAAAFLLGPAVSAAQASAPTTLESDSAVTTSTDLTAKVPALQWIKGPLRADKVMDCPIYTSSGNVVYGDGFGAQVSYEGDPENIMTVGEQFYVRFQVRLITIPCVEAGLIPEFIPPHGMDFAEDEAHPVRWSVSGGTNPSAAGGQDDLYLEAGKYGGLVVGTHVPRFKYKGTNGWHLQRADGVLEIQIPMRVDRPMKGDQSQIPDCYTTKTSNPGVKYYYPCAKDKAGDHLQVGMFINDGGDRTENSVHVGVFAEAAAPAPVSSTVSAAFTDSSMNTAQTPSLRVAVNSGKTATGTVTVKDGSKTVKTFTLTAAHNNKATVSLPKLSAGKHTFTVSYSGSKTVRPSTKSISTTVVKAKSAVKAAFVDSTISAKVAARLKIAVTAGLTPTGTLTVKDGTKTIKTVKLASANGGKITVTLPKLKAGTHTISVGYGGNSALLTSKASVRLSVSK